MNYIKEYLLQLLTDCSNKLRLDSAKLEIVTLLKEEIYHAESLELLFRDMKKVTEFAKLAIRLNEVVIYLNTTKVDFKSVSKKFEEHSEQLHRDLTPFLDILTGLRFKKAMEKVHSFSGRTDNLTESSSTIIDFSAPKGQRIAPAMVDSNTAEDQKENRSNLYAEDTNTDAATLSDIPPELNYQQYESTILHPVRGLDDILKALTNGEINADDLTYYSKLLMRNAHLALKFGTDVVARMHQIIAKALPMIRDGEIKPIKENIEGIRACLIVIVALVRNKDVDIKVYINRAEDFGNKIIPII